MRKVSLTIFVMTYNRPHYLCQTIESILSQTYNDFVLHILDNASDIETWQVVNTFSDERIVYTRHLENIGLNENTQYALSHCDTDFFVIFHDDDIMEPNFIEMELEYMLNHEDVDVFFTNAMKIDENNCSLDLYSKDERKYVRYEGDEYIDTYLRYRKSYITPSAMYKKSFFDLHDLCINMNVGPCADVTFFIDICNAGGVIVETNIPLMKYRIHRLQESSVKSITMHCELIKYLNSNYPYDEMMRGKKNMQDTYYMVSSKAILLDYIRGKINIKDRDYILNRYGQVILHSKGSELMVSLMKRTFDLFPHISKIIVEKYASIKHI